MDGREPTTNPETPIEPRPLAETIDPVGPGAAAGASRLSAVGSTHPSEPPPMAEARARLRLRMRRGAALGALGFFLFLLKDLATGRYETPFERIGLVIHVAATIVMLVVSAILWGRWRLEKWQLRAIEYIGLVVTVAYFAWYQWDMFRLDRAILDLPPGLVLAIAVDRSDACMLRWFTLIVLYGISIPDNWLRCAAHSLCIAAAPILVTWAVCSANGYSFLFYDNVGDMVIWAAVAVLLVTFSSRRIDRLWRAAIAGRRLGQYRLIRSLGQHGGMGEIYLAEHPLLSRPCVIKRVRSERAHDETTRLRFEREARVTARLTHWNNVKVFDFGQDEDGMFYYVMEFLDGINLEELVETEGALAPARAVHFLLQVCDALREAHSLGLIHRDIKPSNIMCCRRGVVHDVAVLLDYGIVRSPDRGDGADRLTLEDRLMGTPAYMSPEQASGRDLDLRSDIYSLGAVAFYLLAARPAFPGANYLQVISDQREKAAPSLGSIRGGIPGDLEQVIMRCLEKDPGQRFQSALELREALSACACAGQWTEHDAFDSREARPVAGR